MKLKNYNFYQYNTSLPPITPTQQAFIGGPYRKKEKTIF
jgi:hypothetical protein